MHADSKINNNMNISFIMPAYNCADTIKESVDSIFNGNFAYGDEVIIINDASTDKTLEIAEELQKKYPEPLIKIISHGINKGSAAAGRNSGIDQSKNDLIFCLDADNILAPNSIQNLKTYMFENNADCAAFGELHYFNTNIKEIDCKWVYTGQIKLNDALAGCYWPGPDGNYLFTKDSWKIAGRYEESLGGAYDSWAFGIKQLATGAKMVTLENTFYYHRHGYESTFMKDKNKINPSLIALIVLLPYLNLIENDDVDYILSKEHRDSWFENIGKRPIHLKDGAAGINGKRDHSFAKDRITIGYKKYLQPNKFLAYIKRNLYGLLK